jgi:hypothetical protein
MTRLIDADKLKALFPKDSDWEYPVNTNEYVCESIDEQLPVDAVPVSFIQQRIDHLHELAEYEFEYNGGYVGATHIAWHELEKILIEWKEERDANQDKTD